MQSSFNVLILDDEKLALNYLKDTINDVIQEVPNFSNYDVEGTTNQNDFWKLLSEKLPQIIFLDIQMPKKAGLEIAEEIREKSFSLGYQNEQLPIIIFTTAHENYGYQAFKVNALDYVLKPIDEDKILHLFKKILKNQSNLLQPIEDTVTVTSAGMEISIPLHEVVYFKADMKYIVVKTHNKEFLINETISNLEERYPKFIKIHRAYLVNPYYISRFHKKEGHLYIVLKDGDTLLPVSRRQRMEITKKMDYKIISSE